MIRIGITLIGRVLTRLLMLGGDGAAGSSGIATNRSDIGFGVWLLLLLKIRTA